MNDELEVTIEKTVFEGRALARHGRYVIFVDGALPGERVRVALTGRKRRYAFARVLELLEASPHRCDPGCGVFGTCGGCSLLNMDYATQLEQKRGFLLEALHAWPEVTAQVAAVLGMDDPYFFRNKMVYSFGGPVDAPVLGMHRRGDFYSCVSAVECRLQSPQAQEIVRRLLEFARTRGLPPFDERRKVGLVRDLTVREGKRTGQRMVMLTATAAHPAFAELPAVLGELATTVLLGISPPLHNAARLERVEVLSGPGLIEEQLNGLTFEVGPTTFFQTNTLQAERMFALLAQWADEIQPRVVLDLYAGTGPIAFHLARAGRRVIAVETHPASVEAARRNQQRNNLPEIEWLAADVEKAPDAVFASAPDLVVLDPPRSGLLPQAAAKIVAAGAPHLFYVSCNPATLARDLPLFLNAGYVVTRLQPMDMFPHSYHVEALLQLRRMPPP